MVKMIKMDVPEPIHAEMVQAKAAETMRRGRTVTFPELWELMVAAYKLARAMELEQQP